MPGQQERARRTRAAIVQSAAIEFARSGYAAASLNRILERSETTKGAMYFHFGSKEELARAVLQTAVERYQKTTGRWLNRTELEPLEKLHGTIDELALRFQREAIVQAEFRLIVEPEFFADVQSGAGSIWGHAAMTLVKEAKARGDLRADTDSARFIRVLGAALAGQRYMVDLFDEDVSVRDRFEECVEMVLEATATDTWLERFRREGWRTRATIDDVEQLE